MTDVGALTDSDNGSASCLVSRGIAEMAAQKAKIVESMMHLKESKLLLIDRVAPHIMVSHAGPLLDVVTDDLLIRSRGKSWRA